MSERAAKPKGVILVVDDDPDIRLTLEMTLRYAGYEVWTARDGADALARVEAEAREGRAPDLVLSDLKMPRLDGLGLLDAMRKQSEELPFVMISGHGDIATAVDAMQRGAQNFLEKPLSDERVRVTVRSALRMRELARENLRLRHKLSAAEPLIGSSPAMQRLARELPRVAASDASVLITGESGTGKEVVARALHAHSPRAEGPFVAVNCAAIPPELIESELFGHEKGSFTGAHERRTGHFENADGGTLFLDEVGDMPLPAQAKVLRALETRRITRVGESREIAVDIRVVAATHQDLQAMVREKSFREDLYYRLNVVPVHLTPLRERVEDIAPLAQHFLREVCARSGRASMSLDPRARALLEAQSWNGNARQLRNVIQGALVFAEGDQLTPEHLETILEHGQGPARASSNARAPAAGGQPDPFEAESFEAFKEQSEKLFIQKKLAEHGGNVKRTAEALGMQRSHMYKKLERYGLR
jgi:two-component system nitrogen regulation response regulator NtrX